MSVEAAYQEILDQITKGSIEVETMDYSAKMRASYRANEDKKQAGFFFEGQGDCEGQ